jgi:hypothetical protein
MTKKRIELSIVTPKIGKSFLCDFNHKPINPISKKLPYTKGIVLWNPMNKSLIIRAARGTIIANRLSKYTPPANAIAAIGVKFTGCGRSRDITR